MSDAMIQMAPGSRLEDEILLRWRQEWGESTDGRDYETWLEGRLLQLEERCRYLNERSQSADDQFCRIAQFIGGDARQAPEPDKTIAGLVIAAITKLQELLGESQTMNDALLLERDSLRADRDERAKQKGELLDEIQRLRDRLENPQLFQNSS